MTKKISLREYQESVVAKLQSTIEGGATASKLGVQVGQEHWLIDLQDVSEVVAVPDMCHVPLTHHWFRGIANVRGSLYSVIDLSLFMGNEPTMLNASCRLMLVNARYVSKASLLVTKMLGLRNVEQFTPAEKAGDAPVWLSAAYRDAEGRQWKVLDMAALATCSQFLQVATI